MSEISQLKGYVEVDKEKLAMLEDLMPRLQDKLCEPIFEKFESPEMNIEPELCDYDSVDDDFEDLDYAPMAYKCRAPPEKYCPKCGRHFEEGENFCPDCLVILKDISDTIDIKAIRINPNMEFIRKNDSRNILTEANLEIINDFDFTVDDFKRILHSIKAQAFQNMDSMIRDNNLSLDELDVLDKVMLFAKSFVNVEYKSYGEQLGYFEFDRIYVDDRQRKSLQITTMIHELAHFLMKEIITRIICEILDCTKNLHVESVATYILTYSVFNSLIDEYAAHSVEGRFTIFGYQDYSSFIALQKDLDMEHTDIAKTIGNTFSIYIKDLMEGFLDWELREDIKEQFLSDTIERPNYDQLRFESSSRLSDEGFMKAIWLILTEGFQEADEEVIASYEKQFE